MIFLELYIVIVYNYIKGSERGCMFYETGIVCFKYLFCWWCTDGI